MLETELVTVDIVIDPGTPESSSIVFDVVVTSDQGEITRITVQKQLLGEEYVLPYGMWQSETWDTCSIADLPGMTCLSDSPQGVLSEDRTSVFLSTPLNLKDMSWARISFLAKWSVESTKDFMQFEVRTNDGDWTPLCGKYSKSGAPGSQMEIPSPYAAQPYNEPIYDGRSAWVREEVDLTPWIGLDSVELRFFTWSGAALSSQQEDGIYLADIRLHTSRRLHCSDKLQNADEEGVDCGGIDCAPCPTCADGILNGNEDEVDCGGPDCTPCPSCLDGIMNGNETGVDCGGPECADCIPTCDDGIMNGEETGIDCGGPDCPLPCKTICCGPENRSPLGIDFGFELRPNPASTLLKLTYEQNVFGTPDIDVTGLRYEIYDVIGRPFIRGIIAGHATAIDIRDLPAQLYVIRISDTEGRVRMLRFLKVPES
jgi:hypothetical protein